MATGLKDFQAPGRHAARRERRNWQQFVSTFSRFAGSGLAVGTDGKIGIDLAANSGLEFTEADAIQIKLDTDPGLQLGAGGLSIKVSEVLDVDATGVHLSYGNGLTTEDAGTVLIARVNQGLSIVSGPIDVVVATPLKISAGNEIEINIGDGLEDVETALRVKIEADAGVLRTGAGLAVDNTKYVPYTGATADLNLGAYKLIAPSVDAGAATLDLNYAGDGNIELFGEDDSIADLASGKKFVIHRRAPEGDSYIEAYIDSVSAARLNVVSSYLYIMMNGTSVGFFSSVTAFSAAKDKAFQWGWGATGYTRALYNSTNQRLEVSLSAGTANDPYFACGAQFTGSVTIGADLNHDGDNIGFFGTAPVVKDVVTDQAAWVDVAAGADTVDIADLNTKVQAVRDKLQEIIEALQSYGLV